MAVVHQIKFKLTGYTKLEGLYFFHIGLSHSNPDKKSKLTICMPEQDGQIFTDLRKAYGLPANPQALRRQDIKNQREVQLPPEFEDPELSRILKNRTVTVVFE